MEIKLDVTGLDKAKQALADMSPAKRQQAIARALNKAADKGRTEISRLVRDRYVISAAEAKASINVRGASAIAGRLSERLLKATIEIFASPTRRGRSMNMIRFTEKKVTLAEAKRRAKKGTLNQLRFRVRKGSDLKTIEGAFIGNKGRTVFRRTGDKRLPIEPVQVIGVSGMFKYQPIEKQAMQRIGEILREEIARAAGVK